MGVAAIIAVAAAATPAFSAIGRGAQDRATALSALVGRFTPAVGDPVLLERYASLSVESRRNFRFTPAMPRTENRAVTLVVRARPMALAAARAQAADPVVQPIAITPVTYRLGSAVGYSAFANTAARAPLARTVAARDVLSRDTVNIATLPQASRPVDPTVRPSRFGADMRLDSRSLPDAQDRLLDPARAYSVDVTGSYRLSRNMDVTAGVRLQRENDRLAPLTDQRQDSQAVYVGTQFRF
ncbi:MAG: hypothetical protein ACKOUM_12215 [Sphingopyxis sp.]